MAFCGTVLAHLHDMSLCHDSQPAAAFDSQMQCSAQASVPVRQLSVHAYAWNDILVAGSMRERFWSKSSCSDKLLLMHLDTWAHDLAVVVLTTDQDPVQTEG